MNYFRQLNAFYDWLETNGLDTSSIVLWHGLMVIANKLGWPDEFAVAISGLQVKTGGLSADTIERCRNKLSQKGLITWKKRKGRQAAIYRIVPLYREFTPQNELHRMDAGQRAGQSAVQPAVQDAVILKTKTETKTKTEREIACDTIVQAYEQTCGPLRGESGQLQTLLDYLDLDMDARLIIHAIHKSSTADYPAKYADSILRGFQRKGILTLDEALAQVREGGMRVESSRSNGTHKTRVTVTGDRIVPEGKFGRV